MKKGVEKKISKMKDYIRIIFYVNERVRRKRKELQNRYIVYL